MQALSDSLHEASGELSPEWTAEIERRIETVERGQGRLAWARDPGGNRVGRFDRAQARSIARVTWRLHAKERQQDVVVGRDLDPVSESPGEPLRIVEAEG